MIERSFTEDRLAALYDARCPPARERDDFRFYLPMILTAASVLDVGCGTGALLRLARDAGHTRRLCGLDPASAMLRVARQRPDIEWVDGDLGTVRWERAFNLIVMTGHAFQELREDEQIRAALAAIRTALVPGGQFAFETRNPADRGWERWEERYSDTILDANGEPVTIAYQVHRPIVGGIVRTTSTFTSVAWDHPEVTHGALRFIDPESLVTAIGDAGLEIVTQYGDWDESPLGSSSPEIITIARRQ